MLGGLSLAGICVNAMRSGWWLPKESIVFLPTLSLSSVLSDAEVLQTQVLSRSGLRVRDRELQLLVLASQTGIGLDANWRWNWRA